MKSNHQLGIALSGGGVRGVAHLGVLKAMGEFGIYPDMVSGTSAGAIAGAMYCCGYTPVQIVEIIVKTNYFRFLRPSISWKGILNMETLEGLFRKYIKVDRFEDLKIPLSITATDLGRAKAAYFSKGQLIRPLMASCCIPGMFAPLEIEGQFYIDGGVLNNLPVEPLEDKCDYIIGVNCNHLPEDRQIGHIKNLIERTVIMSMNYNVYSRKMKCDYFIEPSGLARYAVLDIKKVPEIFDISYQEAYKYIENQNQLKKLGQITKENGIRK